MGCNSKEEAMAVITEVPCEMAGITFSLNGLWTIKEEADANANTNSGQTVELSAYKEETGSGIQVINEDLTEIEGGTLVRLDDYVTDVQKQLKISDEYSYSCSEIATEKFCGNNYEVFTATIPELSCKQQYYIRRQDDSMITLIFTVFDGDTIESILELVK